MHCVFCGAKQPAAPAPQPGGPQAKTVLGYSAADLMKQAGVAPAPATNRPATGPIAPPAQAVGHAATALAMQPPAAQPAQPAPFQPPAGFPPQQPPQQPPQAGAHAATMFQQAPSGSAPFPQQAPFPAPSPFQQANAPAPFQPQFGPAGQGPQGPQGPSFGGALPGPIPPGAATLPPPSGFVPQGGQFGGSATAATMFMNQGPAPQAGGPAPAPFAPPPAGPQAPTFQQPFPQAQPYQPPPAQPFQPYPPQGQPYQPPGGGMAGYNPVPVSPQPPFLASQTAARMGRPVEPFFESVRLVLLVFGALLLIAFCTPVSTSPLAFHWTAILDLPGRAKIPPLLLASAGFLGVLMALIPLAYVGRAALAAVLGLAPLALGLALADGLSWQSIVVPVGGVTLVAGLLLRNEYRNDVLPRILVTVGVVAVLLPQLIPVAGALPIVGAFKAIGAAAGKGKITAILELVPTVVALVSLIAWLPGPGTAGAKILAWVLILWPVVDHFAGALIAGGFGAAIKGSPFVALLAPVPLAAYLAFAGFGLAALLGKQLERG
jgi:hypothetical protein